MISKRIKTIASFLDPIDCVVDIGCDHGYLGIYVSENHLVRSITLSDISENALNQAKTNIKKKNLIIPTILSNGLDKIDLNNVNTLTISGMGTHTIQEILSDSKKLKNISKIILQSNNHLEDLRRYMNEIGYSLVDEITLLENNIWYVVMCYKKKKQYLTNLALIYGLVRKDKLEYYRYLLEEVKQIEKSLSLKNFKKRVECLKKEIQLKRLLKECRRSGK